MNSPAPGQTGQRQPLTNAQRQARFRERRCLLENPQFDDRTVDLFDGVTPRPAHAVHPVTPAVTSVSVQVVPVGVTPRYFSVEVSSGSVTRVMGCPFCGLVPEVYQPEFSEHWVIRCLRCKCFAPSVADSRVLSCVVVSWNTRGGVLGGAL